MEQFGEKIEQIVTTAALEFELEDAAEAMAAPLRGQAGRFPARHLPMHLRRQGFRVTRHFLDRLLERAQAQGIRFDPRSFASDFRGAPHFRQTRPGYNTRIALMNGLPVLYRMGGPRGLNPVLIGLLPQGALPPAAPVAAPRLRESEFEQELEGAALELSGRCPPNQPYIVRGFTRYSNSVALLPRGEQQKIENIAREVTASFSGGAAPITQVNLLGHADADPARERAEPGFVLRMSRLRAESLVQHLQQRVGAGIASRIQWNPGGAGAGQLAVPNPTTEQERSCNRRVNVSLVRGARRINFVVPVPTSTHTIRVVAKSYIARIGRSFGTTGCFAFDPASELRLAALSTVTDAAYSENPLTDAKDKRYRLFSSCTFRVTCQNGQVISVVPSQLDTDAGLECLPATSVCLHPPPLIASAVTVRPAGPGTFAFSWTAFGRPHVAAEPAFLAVCPRSSVFIWHVVNGQINCTGSGVRIVPGITGSQFPSHRVYVDGAIRNTVAQGVFSNLWVPDPAHPTRVR